MGCAGDEPLDHLETRQALVPAGIDLVDLRLGVFLVFDVVAVERVVRFEVN